MTKQKKYRFRNGDIIDIEQYHDSRYGAPGKGRTKKAKPTVEQMRETNTRNREKRCRQRLLAYFSPGDCLATWTYEVKNRPLDMQGALKDFQMAIRYVRKEYRKRGRELFWIRNIECGTRGAWHIHLIVNEIGETASILQRAWSRGGTWSTKIKNCQWYDEDFTNLANYITKDEHRQDRKTDGGKAKPRLREANYNISRNMPLPEPTTRKLVHWPKEPKAYKGYYIAKIHEGINPVTGYHYRRYTMLRIKTKGKEGKRCSSRIST